MIRPRYQQHPHSSGAVLGRRLPCDGFDALLCHPVHSHLEDERLLRANIEAGRLFTQKDGFANGTIRPRALSLMGCVYTDDRDPRMASRRPPAILTVPTLLEWLGSVNGQAVGVGAIDLHGISLPMIRYRADLAKRDDVHTLRRFPHAKQYALTACFLAEIHKTILNYIVTLSRQGEVSRLTAGTTLQRLEREIEALRIEAAQDTLFDPDEHLAALARSIAEKAEEVRRRRAHYEEPREQLHRERERVIQYLLPKRHTLRGTAQVFPVAIEIRLPEGER